MQRKKNRFAGADNVYMTKNYYVREDVSSDKSGRCFYSRRYIKKDATSTKEYRDIFGPAIYDRNGRRR